jgi:PAS domain S-box-containing protein
MPTKEHGSRGIIWPLVLAIPLIAAMACAIITTLRHRAAESRQVEGLLGRLEQQATYLNTLTWQAVAPRRPEAEALAAVRDARAGLNHTLVELKPFDDDHAPLLEEVRLAYASYLIAADRELQAAAAPDAGEQSRPSTRELIRIYERLRHAILQATSSYHSRADRTTQRADWGIGGTLLGAILGAGFLFLQLDRARQSVRVAVAEQSMLRLSEERFRSLVQAASDVIIVLDVEAGIRYASPSAQRILGYLPEELVGTSLFARVNPAHAPNLQDFFARALCNPGVTSAIEFEFQHRDETWRTLEAIGNNRLFDPGIAGFVLNIREITERKRVEEALRESEEQLRQAQKIEGIGRLAGGVAHDFNNMLAVINCYSEIMLVRMSPRNPMRQYVTEIKEAGLRAADLTRQLLAFSRRSVLVPQVLELNDVVAGLDKMLRRLIGEDIELVAELGEGLGRVEADPGQVQQVIMNLAVNARDAMPRGGKITIRTEDIELDEDYARRHAEVEAGPYVMLSVTDTGTGMDKETQDKIFEPFFTTKEPGKGTGLGLATVWGIVKQSGGHIAVESEPGKGTTFRIYLPRTAEEETQLETPTEEIVRAGAKETVLLVEDEEIVRSVIREVLRTNGYKVLDAGCGEDAVRLCKRKVRIDLLLTDVVMPGMSGQELAEQVRELRPDLKSRVIFMSGYTDDAVVRHGVLSPETAFIQKPFTGDSLARKVREVLDGVAQTAAAVS